MELLTAFRASASAYAFLKSNALIMALSDIELEAAKDALNKSERALDTRLQLTTALAHLESAEIAAKKAMESINIAGNRPALMRRYTKYSFTIGLMAIVYYCLREERLLLETLDKIESGHAWIVAECRRRPSAYHSLVGMIGGNPKHYIGEKIGDELKFVSAFRSGNIPSTGL